MSSAEAGAFEELCAYTLSLGDTAFIHQFVVCAYGAQTADEKTKPLALTFALAGLYLQIEKGCSGRQIQRVHAKLAERKQVWPTLVLPQDRGTLRASDVLAADDRERAINAWCRSVWETFGENHAAISQWVEGCLGRTLPGRSRFC